MRSPALGPSLVPAFDTTVYLVLDDFGKIGRAYLETDEADADLETVIHGLLTGQYNRPVRIVAFNTAERWSDDVTEDICREVWQRANGSYLELPDVTAEFIERVIGGEMLRSA